MRSELRHRAVISIIGVSATAVLSAAFLWLLLVDGRSLGQLGLVGVFSASLLSHLTVVARDMFVPMYLHLTPVYHPIVLGASAGVGAALGEVTTYLLGWGIAETVERRSKVDDRLAGWIRRYGIWAVLLVAATPLPDTPLVLLAGSSRLPLGRLLIAECVGKTTLYSLGAVVGGLVFTGLTGAVGGLAAFLLVLAASILFCVLITWERGRNFVFGRFDRLLN